MMISDKTAEYIRLLTSKGFFYTNFEGEMKYKIEWRFFRKNVSIDNLDSNG